MKLVKFAMMATVLVSSAVAMAGITQREAQIAKERLARCQQNDAVCAGNVIIDALASNRPEPYPGNGGGSNNGNSSRQNLVMIYQDSDSCQGDVLATVVLDGDLQRSLQTCNAQPSSNGNAWSISINGTCNNIGDTSTKSACLQALNIINGAGGK